MEFSHPEYLVSTKWLADRLDDPSIRILDVTAKLTSRLENRAEADCYRDHHIPGSLFFDVAAGKGVLSDRDAALPWMWPTAEQVATSLTAVGIGPDTRVVLVARTPRDGIDSGTMWCTRAWWTLHHSGVDVAILAGGIEQWELEERPMTADPTTIPESERFVASADSANARATKDDVLAAVQGDGSTCLVDALGADSFDGTGPAYGPRSGHITGAINVPFRSLIERETAAFVDADQMHSALSAAGLFDAPKVITYCGGAIAATVDAFALALFGRTNVAVYDGSLMEWSADADLPMTDPSTA